MKRDVVCICLYVFSGLLTAYLYQGVDLGKAGLILPGVIYIVATLVMFILTNTKIRRRDLGFYVITMLALYIVVYFATFYTMGIADISGIITCGLGSLLSFLLTEESIIRIKYNSFLIFLLGAGSFGLNDILLQKDIAEVLRPVYNVKRDPLTMFAGAFFFWQSIVGIKLYLTVRSQNIA